MRDYWKAAPPGATHHFLGHSSLWYKATAEGLFMWVRPGRWRPSQFKTLDHVQKQYPDATITARSPAAVEQHVPVQNAASYCDAAKGHMVDRATTYDAPAGERSMAKTVTAFNALTGHQLTEEQGWLFMETLKMARSQQGQFRQDNYEDAVAYAALRGEAAGKERSHD